MPGRRRARRALAVVGAAVLLGAAVAGAPPAAASGGQATLVGTVHTAAGPLANAAVVVLDATSGATLASGLTRSDGTYRIDTVPAGVAVRVKFRKAYYLTTFADHATSFAGATVYTLAAGDTRALPDQVLVREAVIKGQVLSWMDPLTGAKVSVFDATTGRLLESVQLSDTQYEYRIGGLPAVPVKVRASKPGYLQAYADGVHTWAAARSFTLHPGEVLSQTWSPLALYLDLTPGGQISGELLGLQNTSCVGGYDDPLGNADVVAVDAQTLQPVARTRTDRSGRFTLTGIVHYAPMLVYAAASGWITDWSDDATSPRDATPYVVRPGQSVDIGLDDVFSQPLVDGYVLADGTGAGGATVGVYDAATGALLGSATTDPDGFYVVEHLPVTKVKVRASKPGWVSVWADDTQSFAAATAYPLEPGGGVEQCLPGQGPLQLHLVAPSHRTVAAR